MKKIALMILLVVLAACSTQEKKESKRSVPTITPTEDIGYSQAPAYVYNESTGTLVLAEQFLSTGDGNLLLNITMPEGYKFNNSAPFTLEITSNDASVVIDEQWSNFQTTEPEMPLEIPLMLSEGTAKIDLNLTIYWCEAIQQTLCFVEQQQVEMPVRVSDAATQQQARFELALVPPTIP